MLAKYKRVLLSFSSVLIFGCTSINQSNKLSNFNESLFQGEYRNASDYALDLSGYDAGSNSIDDPLWALQAGTVLAKLGEYQTSNNILDAVEAHAKSENSENILLESGEGIGAIAGSDAMLDYQITNYDGVMANALKAWNFMALGDMNNARVEWNRAYERERRAVQHFKAQISNQEEGLNDSGMIGSLVAKATQSKNMQYALQDAGIVLNRYQPYTGYTNPFVSYSEGLFFLTNGKSRSDYKRAAQAFERAYGLTGSQVIKRDLALAKSLIKKPNQTIPSQVWVIFENGQSIVKEEKRLDLPLFIGPGDLSYAGAALPRLKQRKIAHPSIKLAGQPTQLLADMDKIIASEFDVEFPLILTREVTRMLVKSGTQKLLAHESEWLEGAGAVYTFATTGADIRSFSALPSQYQVARAAKQGNAIELEIGKRKLSVPLNPHAQHHVVWVSAPSEYVKPHISVIEI